MLYEYQCTACAYNFEVVKTAKESSNPETCPRCDAPHARRIYSPPLAIMGAKVKDSYFDVSLGQVIKSDRQKNEILKQKGLIEVGTEKSEESFHKNTVEKKKKERDEEWSKL